jgi:hypothetical protein
MLSDAMAARSKTASKTRSSQKKTAKRKPKLRGALQPKSVGKPKLLSGGNPQIAKADGDAPVQAYIAGMPGWKRDVGRRLDALIERAVPGVRKAVRWNTPFYGVAAKGGWFLGFHCFDRYVKVTFLRGDSLRPLPPGPSKVEHVRYLDIHEHDTIDDAQLTRWLKQAARLPGDPLF